MIFLSQCQSKGPRSALITLVLKEQVPGAKRCLTPVTGRPQGCTSSPCASAQVSADGLFTLDADMNFMALCSPSSLDWQFPSCHQPPEVELVLGQL